MYDTGWQKLLTRGFDWSLYALVLILCSNVFAAEYNTRTSAEGFYQILRTTKHGRNKTFYQKVRTVVVLSVPKNKPCKRITHTAASRLGKQPNKAMLRSDLDASCG